MSSNDALFSERFGFQGPAAEITVRDSAPDEVRVAVLRLGYRYRLGPGGMRDALCEVLLKRPDPGNWSAGNIENEVHRLADDAPWYKIYDFVERLYFKVGKADYTGDRQRQFEASLNPSFKELGVGWQIDGGRLMARGSEAFTLAIHDAVAFMRDAGAPTAANEVHESLSDISRRPNADITGAIQHAPPF